MNRVMKAGLGLLIPALMGVQPTPASAQVGTTSTTGGMPPAAMLANPYLNPYMNPYMNPSATLQPMRPANAAMFLYAANSANGGLGSGRISGTRGGVGGAAVAASKAAEMPNSVGEARGRGFSLLQPDAGHRRGWPLLQPTRALFQQ